MTNQISGDMNRIAVSSIAVIKGIKIKKADLVSAWNIKGVYKAGHIHIVISIQIESGPIIAGSIECTGSGIG
jgi:hypothetical protein